MLRARIVKGTLTVLGAIALSTLGIFAADSLRGIDGNFASITGGACPQGMVPMKNGSSALCVDMYEASASKGCPHARPGSTLDSEENTNDSDCNVASTKGAEPWKFISLPQAQRMCARVGKRLPTSDEWYRAALGTESPQCAIKETAPARTGDRECTSAIGIYDAVGNLWEWVDASVVGNRFGEQILPREGYVDSVDASGVALGTADRGNRGYGEDYFWSKEVGTFGMIRGGFYGSGEDAGLYTINAAVETSFATQGVGFRCVKDIF